MADAATKFASFLTSKKLNPKRVIAASHELEKLRPEDRAIKAAKRKGKKGDAPADAVKETRKPRTGRPVTDRAMAAALSGAEPVSGPTKTRILKAVNHLLEQKKQEKVEMKTLF